MREHPTSSDNEQLLRYAKDRYRNCCAGVELEQAEWNILLTLLDDAQYGGETGGHGRWRFLEALADRIREQLPDAEGGETGGGGCDE